jgi:hypothetical protein
MKNKPTASSKKSPVVIKDLKAKKNPKGGTITISGTQYTGTLNCTSLKTTSGLHP